MTDFEYETERLIANLKKFNEYLEAINKALREEKSNGCKDGTEQDSDRTESTEEPV